MPTDPVYNPHLPSASVWTPSSSASSDSHWSADLSMPGQSYSSWSTLLVGLVAGTVAGAALALMLAPRRGSELRGSIRSLAGDAVHRATTLIEQGRDALRTRSAMGAGGWRLSSRTGAASMPTRARPGQQPLTASIAEISGVDRRFEEPLGG